MPLLQALRDLGGSATPVEARKKIIENEHLSDDVINETRGKRKLTNLKMKLLLQEIILLEQDTSIRA
jgi:hypothetical protein